VPRKPRFLLRWSPTGKMFDQDGKLVVLSNSESHVDCSNGCSKHMKGNLKLLINFVWKFMGTVRFGNDHVAAILGFGDLQKHKANVSNNETQQKNQPEIKKSKKVGFIKRLVTPKPRKSSILLRWSPTGRLFDQDGKISDSSESESQSDSSNGDNACWSKHMTGNLKLLINFIWKFVGTVRFGNDHVAAILGFGDLQWG
nr:integrase, catalytic region, zinc finger, CCHC-type, peptidase aspartic, catalytic [Tanacetum cinerariifolium]